MPTVQFICQLLEVTEQTHYRWRQKYGGMKPEMAKQLKALEQSNTMLGKMVAEQDSLTLNETHAFHWITSF